MRVADLGDGEFFVTIPDLLLSHHFISIYALFIDAVLQLDKLKLRTGYQLRFHKGILLVKANRNYAMSAYQTDSYPGLLHFMYIDRTQNIIKV